ncbi:ATP-binding protein [Streptomyces sp. NPDC002685]|uniref:ATP-binding protein n=1 Tax=Streptomyces sp. NPDC002685 TaxID=3154540 RepID=UPI003323408C
MPTKVIRRPEGKERPHNAPWYTLYPRRWWSRLSGATGRRWRRFRTEREAHRSIAAARSWRPGLFSLGPLLRIYAFLGTVLLFIWVAVAVYDFLEKNESQYHNVLESPWFDAVNHIVGPVLTGSLLLTFFLLYWYHRTKKPLMDKARTRPHDLVPTAGTLVNRIVGRHELSQVIAQTLRNRKTRKPYLLVGGVGVGKTAVLVELTRMLAQQSAVPVPISLRDMKGNGELDFEEMARRRFAEEADQGVLAGSNIDKTWRQLRLDGKVVVIADGLEEALLDEKYQEDRDNIIRRAIERADRQKLPLVIASRPHTPLEGTRAAIADMEPLSEEAALEYLIGEPGELDERRLDWVVETAQVVDSPIYLRIARLLQQRGLLDHLTLRDENDRLDTRSNDCSTLRLGFLNTYRQAIEDGRIFDDVVMDRGERRETMWVMSALACLGLLQDSIEVTFDDFVSAHVDDLRNRAQPQGNQQEPSGGAHQHGTRLALSPAQRDAIWDVLSRKIGASSPWLNTLDYPNECRTELARHTANGQLLGLVYGRQNKVRFPHSILQAYLGYRLLREVPDDKIDAVVEPALHSPGPSRELLIALVLLSRHRAGPLTTRPATGPRTTAHAQSSNGTPPRSSNGTPPQSTNGTSPRLTKVLRNAGGEPARRKEPRPGHRSPLDLISRHRTDPLTTQSATGPRTTPHAQSSNGTPPQSSNGTPPRLAELLSNAAANRHDAKYFDLYAAALEIDGVDPAPIQDKLAQDLDEQWAKLDIRGEQRTIEGAKLRLVRNFGAALRERDRRRKGSNPRSGRSGQEPARPTLPYKHLFQIGTHEPSHAVRIAIAHQIAAGGDAAFQDLRTEFPLGSDPISQYLEKIRYAKQKLDRDYTAWLNEEDSGPAADPGAAQRRQRRHDRIVEEYEQSRTTWWRHFTLRAWLVPMIVGSVSEKYRDEAKERLSIWLRNLTTEAGQQNPPMPLSLENALAQGFKNAANRRRRHPDAYEETRAYMVKQAEKMLTCSRYWYTQLSLLHALCLWELPDTIGRTTGSGAANRRRNQPTPPATNLTTNGDMASSGPMEPIRSVTRWLAMAGSAHEKTPPHIGAAHERHAEKVLHPFIAEAGDLVTLALETGHPERFIWIDENGASDNVGSTPADPERYRKHNLWIAPSVGWSSLHPRAQRLLADVLVMLNLTEGTGSPDDIEERLELANKNNLPHCLTHDRSLLHPERSVGRADRDASHTTCMSPCEFRLCPYPPQAGNAQAEMAELFCRQQQSLLHSRFRWHLPAVSRHTAPWVSVPVRKLHAFWEEMANRNRKTTDGDEHLL